MSLLRNVQPDDLATKIKQLPKRLWDTPIVISGQAFYLSKKNLIANVAELFDADDANVDYVSFQVAAFVPAGPNAIVGPQAFPLAKHAVCDWPQEQLFAGLVAVVGGKGAGKSKMVADSLGTEVIIRYGEPVEQYDLDERAVHVASFLDAIELAFILALAGVRVAIDSFRTLIYGLKGAAGEKGIKAEIFNLLTDFSNLFGYTGNSVVAVLNPLVQEDAMEIVFSNAASSTVGAYHLSAGTVRAAEFRTLGGRIFKGVEPSTANDEENRPDRVPNKGTDVRLSDDAGDAEGPRGNRSDRAHLADDDEYTVERRRGARISFDETE